MGNDGGSIPSRGELVKTKEAPKRVQETAAANNDFAWKYCILSRAPLADPLASDGYGRLYNKESVIQYILDNEAFGDAAREMSHIKSMKDIVELKVTKSNGKRICEVTRKDMDGSTRFIYLSTCGHTLSADALKKVESSECLICSMPYNKDDVIPLNPTEKDIEGLQLRLKRLEDAGLTHSGSVMKKKKKKRMAEEEADAAERKAAKRTGAPVASKVDTTAYQSAALKSLLHTTDNRIVNDGFMTRGTSSRVG